LTCTTPTEGELARQQCVSFLEATLKSNLADDEGELWERSLAVVSAMERSLLRDLSEAVVPPETEEPANLAAESLVPRPLSR
jgi:hypothetical protein